MRGVTIEFSRETKYLGEVSGNKFLWNSRIKRVKDRAIKAPIVCKGVMWHKTSNAAMDLYNGC
jgi:hypothetical protein